MAHQRQKQALHLTHSEISHLKRLVQAHRTPQVLARRAQLLLLAHAHPSWNAKQLAAAVNRKERWVRKWRRRWQEMQTLTDLPRSGAPRRFSAEVRTQVTALACSLPRAHGVPLSHWSRAELARQVVTTPGLPAISARSIGQWLSTEQIHPWRYHSWQHIQDQELFLQRARPVLQLYEHAQSLLQEGTWVVCVDEKTSIQAREAEQAPRLSIPKHTFHQSPRYHRRGALHLMAALSVADGMVYGQCSLRKRFLDFTAFMQTVLIAEALRRQVHTVAFILDNGSTHAPNRYPGRLAEQSHTLESTLAFQVYWLPTNASWLDQIEIWFSLLQRKLPQPNHFGSLDELRQAIPDFIARYNQAAKPLQ